MLNKHEDDRRILYDWAQGEFKSAKVLEAKEDGIVVGNHYHNNKDEEFFLFKGMITILSIGVNTIFNIAAPYYIRVPRGEFHLFLLEKGSILLGVATELFDPSDENKMLV